MYVVRRAFRNYNQMILPGSVVEPESIKWFKTRLKDRVIIEINAHNFKEWHEYFKDKFGVDLKSLEELENAGTQEKPENAGTQEKPENAETQDTPQGKPVIATAVVATATKG